MVCVGVLEKGHQTLNDESCIQCWNPIVLNSLCADLTSVLLDVRVKNSSLEVNLLLLNFDIYLRSLEWVVISEVNIHNESSTLVRSIRLNKCKLDDMYYRSKDCSVPVSKTFSNDFN